jgi:hypothetical protein
MITIPILKVIAIPTAAAIATINTADIKPSRIMAPTTTAILKESKYPLQFIPLSPRLRILIPVPSTRMPMATFTTMLGRVGTQGIRAQA